MRIGARWWQSISRERLHLPSGAAAHDRARLEEDREHPSIIGETGNIGRDNCAGSKSGRVGLAKWLARDAVFHPCGAGKFEEAGIGITP